MATTTNQQPTPNSEPPPPPYAPQETDGGPSSPSAPELAGGGSPPQPPPAGYPPPFAPSQADGGPSPPPAEAPPQYPYPPAHNAPWNPAVTDAYGVPVPDHAPMIPPPPPKMMMAAGGGGGAGYEAYPHSVPTSMDVEMGGQEKTNELSFSSQSIRQAFIRKVFGIVAIQLAVVTGMTALFVFQQRWKNFVKSNEAMLWVSIGVYAVAYGCLIACKKARRRFPTNVILLGLLTVSLGYVVAMVSSFCDIQEVFIALCITVIVVASVALFAVQTRCDFTTCGMVMFALSMVLFFTGIAAVSLRYSQNAAWFHAFYCGLGAATFMLFLVIDIQLIMGGKRENISPEDYVLAAAEIFIDIVYIFMYILKLVAIFNKKD